jgi:hypothetical protein
LWTVTRSFPWPSRRRAEDTVDGYLDSSVGDDLGFEASLEDPIAGLFGFVLFILLALVIAFFLPFVLFAVEVALAVVAVALYLRGWRVTAETSGPPAERVEWRVKGWRKSKRAVDEVARELSAGVPAAPGDAV